MGGTPHADGPDISHWNRVVGARDPSWRLTSSKCSEGGGSGDVMFPSNWRWADGARWRGAFHWLRSDSSIAGQADNFLHRVNNMGGLKVGDLLQTDWEVTPGIPLVTSDQVIEFNDRLRQKVGRDCVITYSSDWLPDSTLDADSRREFDEWRQARPDDALWYANYNTGSSPTGGWTECAKYGADVWQWSSTYTHPSIAGGFDMNHVFNPAVLDRLTGRSAVVVPPIEIIPPKPPHQEDDMPRFIQPADGDTAVFLLDGTVATWVPNSTVLSYIVADGIVLDGTRHPVHRDTLKALRLAGIAPPQATMPGEPGYPVGYAGKRTTAADFGGPA